MADQPNDGGPAFPQQSAPAGYVHSSSEGMSLRDYFAAKALPSALQLEIEMRRSQIAPGAFRYDIVALSAYTVADAMLRTREEVTTPVNPKEAQHMDEQQDETPRDEQDPPPTSDQGDGATAEQAENTEGSER